MRNADRYLWRIYLQSDGQIKLVQFERDNWGSPYLKSNKNDSIGDNAILLDETQFEDGVKGLMNHWQEDKAFFSVHHQNDYYLHTRIKRLESELQNLHDLFKDFTQRLSRLT